MNSANLKVMNEPFYPLAPSTVSKHKLLTIGVYLGSLIFIIFFFLIIDILDHTLRNIFKAEQLTGNKVLGAFTRQLSLAARRYNKIYTTLSAKTLCNSAITYFNPNQYNIVNLISNEPREGKSYVMKQIAQQFTERGFDVIQLSWQDEFQTDAQAFIQSLNLEQFDLQGNNNLKDKVIIVEYPSLKDAALTSNILQNVSLNLQIIDSRRTWKNKDQQLFERTKEMCNNVPIFLILNYTNRDAAEDINGLIRKQCR